MSIENRLRASRERAGLTQQALAEAADLSRQALSALEAGRAAPSVGVALRLARALDCRVEDLFRLDDDGALLEAEGTATGRVALAWIGERWVAHPLGADPHTPADGLAEAGKGRRLRVRPLASTDELRRRVLVAGCAPPLGVLARRAADRGAEPVWLTATSERALDLLARGRVHVAGAHLFDEDTGEFNVPLVRRRLGAGALVVTLARWEQGLLVRRGNPLGLRTVADALRPGVRFAAREPGAGARRLLERLAGGPVAPAGPVVHGHMEVGQAIALGAADAGIAIRAAAIAAELDFIQLAEERFDLAFAPGAAADPRLARLLDTLAGRAFRRDLESFGGYDAGETGRVVAGAA